MNPQMNLSLRSRLHGSHVHVTVFMNHENCGALVMKPAEWIALNVLLAHGQQRPPGTDRIDWDPAADETDESLRFLLLEHAETQRTRQGVSRSALLISSSLEEPGQFTVTLECNHKIQTPAPGGPYPCPHCSAAENL